MSIRFRASSVAFINESPLISFLDVKDFQFGVKASQSGNILISFQKILAKAKVICYYLKADINERASDDMFASLSSLLDVNYQLIEVRFATPRVVEKIEGRGLTLDDCIEILENAPYEIRSGTDVYGNPKYAAYGQTYDGMKALVIYVRERPDLYIILSARKNLSRAEIRLIRRRRKI